jgi:hypothetical protein
MNWFLIDPFTLPSIAIEKRCQCCCGRGNGRNHWKPVCALDPIPAVYFLIEGVSEVLYIGATYNLRSRWRNHHCLTQYEPEGELRIAWIEIEDDRMRGRIETALIWSYRPTLNRISGHGPYGRGPLQPFLPGAGNGS